MILRELLASVGLQVDGSGFQRAEAAIGSLNQGFSAIKQLAGAATIAIAGIVGATAQATSEVVMLSQELGVSTTAFQELNFAAQQNGVSTETMVAGLKTLAHNLQLASLGGEEAVKNFRQLGISVGYGRKHFESADVWLGRIAEKFAALPADANRTAIAMGIFGESGLKLLPLLNKGKAGIEELRQAAYDYGVVLDDQAVAAGQQFNASTRSLTAAARGLTFAIGGPLMEALTPYLSGMAEWVKANRKVIAADVVGVVVGLGSALGKAKQALNPYLALLGLVLSNVWVLKAAVVALSLALAGQLLPSVIAVGTALESIIRFGGWRYVLAWVASVGVAAATTALWVVGLGLLLLIIEDFYAALIGGKSVLGAWAKALDGVLKPKPGEFWLTTWFKTAASAIFDIQGAWMKLKNLLGPIGMKVLAVSTMGGSLLFDKVLSPDESSAPTGNRLYDENGKRRVSYVEAPGAPQAPAPWDMSSFLGPGAVDARFGGGASPAASVAAAAGATNNSRTVNDSRTFSPTYYITNNGGDEEALKRVLEEHDRKLFGEAHASVQGGGL